MKDERGRLIVISGFSGVGKGTVIRTLLDEDKKFIFSVSCTTRYHRKGERDGKEYFFLSREEFEQGIAADRFLEHAIYSGNYYGTPADYVESCRAAGRHVVLDIEYHGAFQVKAKCPDALMIFLIPPSAQTLLRRLRGRGTETEAQILERMRTAATQEADAALKYEAILVNDTITQVLADIRAVVAQPELAAAFYRQNTPLLSEIRDDLLKAIENEKGVQGK